MSRPGISELAKQVKAIKEKRDMTYSQIAEECDFNRYMSGENLGMTSNTIAGLCNTHSLHADFEPWVRNWVKQNA